MTSLFTHAEFWLTHLARTTLHAGVLAMVVGMLVLMLGRRLPAGVRYALWALVLLRLAVPVLPAVRWSPLALLPQASPAQSREANVPQPSGAPKWEVRLGAIELPPSQKPVAVAPIEHHTPRWPIVLAGLWASVAFGLVFLAVLSYRRLLRRVRRGHHLDNPAILRLIEDCSSEMGVHVPAIVESALVDGPALVGILQPTIVMPLGLAGQLSPRQWRHVILHELAHLRRHDLWIDWGILVLVCLHWFNPLAWLAAWRFRTEREVLRDTMVLAHGREQEREAYGRTLVELIETLARPAARLGTVGMLAERADLRRRLTMILSGNRRSVVATILGSVLIAGLVLVAFTRAREPVPMVANGDPRGVGGDAPATAAPLTRPVANDAAMQAMQKVLDKRLQELHFDYIPLSDVIDFLRDVSGANIAVNWKTLEAAGVEKTAPVTVRLRDIKFSKALSTILADVGGGNVKLGYTTDDGVIAISTSDDLNKNTVINVYDIRDLLLEVPNFAEAAEPAPARKSQPIQYNATLVHDITTLICETVDRDSWVDRGWRVGQIKFLSGQLIITQLKENHDQIVALLDKLRESKAIQVSIAMRFVTISRAALAELSKDGGVLTGLTDSAKPAGGPNGPTTRPGVFVDDARLKVLLAAVQGAKDSAVLTAPRLTMFNGQTGMIHVGAERVHIARYRAGAPGEEKWVPVNATVKDGIEVEIQPTVSADRKQVTVRMHPRVSVFRAMRDEPWDKAPAGEKLMVQKPEMDVQEIKTIVSIPDRGTLVMALPKAAGKDAESDAVTLFMTRPEIVIQPDKEHQKSPLLTPPR